MKYDKDKTAKRMYFARIKNGYKQGEVAKGVNMSQGAYSKIELGDHSASISQLLNVAEFLNVPILWLLGIDDDSELTDSELLDLYDYKKYLIYKRNIPEQD